MAERIDPVVRFDVFRIDGTRHGADIYVRSFGHVLEHHRHEERFVVVIDEKLALQRNDRFHHRL